MSPTARRGRQRRRPCTRPDAAPGAGSRSPASASRRRSAPARPRWSSPAAAPRRQPRGQGHLLGPPRRRRRPHAGSWPARSSTTPCSTPCDWLGEHEGAEVDLAAGRRAGRVDARDAARERSPTTPDGRAGHRRCGPTTRSARSSRSPSWPRWPRGTASRSTPTRCRRSARCRSTSPPAGVDALTVTGHKLGGPIGVGALLLGRERRAARRCCTAAARSATSARAPSTCPASSAFAVAVEIAVKAQQEHAARLAALRDELVARVRAAVPDAVLNGDPEPTGCPATRTSRSPAARATRCCCCSTRRASPARPARPARPGWPSRRHVLLAMGADDDRRAVVAALHARPHLDRAPTSTRCVAALPGGGRAGPARAGLAEGAAARLDVVRVLAAMSGGVDSAVAAARAVDGRPRRDRRAPGAVAQPADLPHRRPRLLHARGLPRRPPAPPT